VRRLLIWSERGWRQRLATIICLLLIPGSVGVLLGAIGGDIAVLLGLLVAAVVLVWIVATLPTYKPARYQWDETQIDPTTGWAPCALCGYDCSGYETWAPVPGFTNAFMHANGCEALVPYGPPLAAPTHRRGPGGRYERIG